MRNQFVFHAMQEKHWTAGVLDRIDITEALVNQGGDHKAEATEKTSGDILN